MPRHLRHRKKNIFDRLRNTIMMIVAMVLLILFSLLYFLVKLNGTSSGQNLSQPDTTEGRFCNGITAFQCPQGYSCVNNMNNPDAGGYCTKKGNNTESIPEHFKKYTNANFGFSFNYPDNMIIEEYNLEDPETRENGIRIVMKNETDSLTVATDFRGGWGRNPCMYQTERRVDKFRTQIITFKEQAEGDNCGDKFMDFVALINYENGNGPFPIEIELSKVNRENFYSDSVLFDRVLSSFRAV